MLNFLMSNAVSSSVIMLIVTLSNAFTLSVIRSNVILVNVVAHDRHLDERVGDVLELGDAEDEVITRSLQILGLKSKADILAA